MVGVAVGLVTVPVMARVLGTSGLGIYTAALAYVGIFGSLTQLGLNAAAVQRMASEPEREAQWFGALVRMRLLLSIAMTFLCVVSIPFVLDTENAQLVALIFVPTIITSATYSLMSVFQTRLRAAVPQALTVAQNLLWLTTVVVLGLMGGGTVAFAIGYMLTALALAVMQIVATRRLAGISWGDGWSLWRPLGRVALPLGIAAVMIFIYYRIDAVLLLELAGPDEAGIYGAAYRFLDALLFLPAVVMATFYPVLSAVFERDPARGRLLVQRCAEVMWVITLPCLVVTLVLAEEIISLLLGSEFARSAVVLPILMAALVSIGFGSLAGFLAPILGLQWRLALYATVGAVANVALNVVLIPPYGAVGSATATLVTEVLTMTLMFAAALLALRMRLALGRFAGALLAAAGMGIVLLLLRPLGVVVALLGGALVYPLLLLALRAVRLDELRALRSSEY
jgi:O-antigen/teichoic acid export membrane protein